MKQSPIISIQPLGNQWATQDPFLFCAHHYDEYPGGNENLGPNASLAGRNIGQDFAGKDGWNMYHGQKIPGFPAHPHCGFETVTLANIGLVDHSDSLGATGRFGNGDVQWLTSGKGVQHAEMFPLLNKDENPFEIFQLWLNLPSKSKGVDPYYEMLWSEDIPTINKTDEAGKSTTIDLIAGQYNDQVALPPTPNSWAADPQNEVQIWIIKMEANARFTLPASKGKANRSLFFYKGSSMQLAEKSIQSKHGVELHSEEAVEIINGDSNGYFLLLQGKPINEPVAQYGPFVANTQEEIYAAMSVFQKTQFGGWPWPNSGPTLGKEVGRYAKYVDGSEEYR